MTFEELKQLANDITDNEQTIAQVSNFLLQFEEFRVQLHTLREKLTEGTDINVCISEETQQKIQALHVLKQDIINIYNNFSKKIKERQEIDDIINEIKNYNVSELNVGPIATIQEIIALAEDRNIDEPKIAKVFRDFLQQNYQPPLLKLRAIDKNGKPIYKNGQNKNEQQLTLLHPTIANSNVHLLVLLSKFHQQAEECAPTDSKYILFSKINDLYKQLSTHYPNMLDDYKAWQNKVEEIIETNKLNITDAYSNDLESIFANDQNDKYIQYLKESVEQQKNSLVENKTKDEKTLVRQQQSLAEYQNIATENITQLKEIEKESCANIFKHTLDKGDIKNDLANIDISQTINQVRSKQSKDISQDTIDKLEDTYKQLKIIQTQANPIDKRTFYNIFSKIFDDAEQIPQSIQKDWKIFKQSITSERCSLEDALKRLAKIKAKIQDQIQPLNQEQQPNNLIQPNENIQEQQPQPQPQEPQRQPQPQEQSEEQKQQEKLKQLQNLVAKLDQVKNAVKNETNVLKYPEILKQCKPLYENAPQEIQSELEPLVKEQQGEQKKINEIITKVQQQARDYINSIIAKQKQQEELKQLQNLVAKLDQVKDAVKDEKNALKYPEIVEKCRQLYENAPQEIQSEIGPLVEEQQGEQKQVRPVGQQGGQILQPIQPEEQRKINEIIENVKQQAYDYIKSIIDKINKIPDEELTKKLAPFRTIEHALQIEYNNLLQKLDSVLKTNEPLTTKNELIKKLNDHINNFNKAVVNTINRLINTKELYDYLMYIKSQISNIKDKKLKDYIANTLTQLTPSELTIPKIEDAAKEVVKILQQYIEGKITEITDQNLKNYLQNNQLKLDKLNELKAETILPAIRKQINIIEKISKNIEKYQSEQALKVLEQLIGNFTIIPQQEGEIGTRSINTELQELYDNLQYITNEFQNFYKQQLLPIRDKLKDQEVLAASLQTVRQRTQEEEDRLKAINNKINELKEQYDQRVKNQKSLQEKLYKYLKYKTETLTEWHYPNDSQLILEIKNNIKALGDSNDDWDDNTFIDYAFGHLPTITEKIVELSETKDLYDKLKYISTNTYKIKDTMLRDKFQEISREHHIIPRWNDDGLRDTRVKLNYAALDILTATKTYIKDKINNIKNATLKAEAEKILSPLNNFNPQLDKQWLTETIERIKYDIEQEIKTMDNATLKTQISTLKECIMPKLHITNISSLERLNAVKQKIKLHIDAVNNEDLKRQIKHIILKPLNSPICSNISEINSILKTKLPQAIQMMNNVSYTIKLMQAADEQKAQEILKNLKDNLKGAEQMFQVPVQQDTLDEIYPTKDLLQQISNKITAIEKEIENLPKEELQQKLQELYNNHNRDCEKYTLIKVLLEPFSSKEINIDKAEIKEKFKQIKDLLQLFSSADINIDTATKAVNDHFNLIKSIIGLEATIIDDVYTQFKKQIYSIKSIDNEINNIKELLKRNEVRNNNDKRNQLQQNLDSLTQFKQELTETTEPIIPDLIQELQNLEQKQNNNQIVTEISTIIKDINKEFKNKIYSIQSITNAINKINELLKHDEIQNNQDEQTKEYITQIQKTLESLSDFKQKLKKVSERVTLDWDEIFDLPETVKDEITINKNNRNNALDIIIGSCLDKPYNALNNIKYVIYKIKQIQTNTNAENETSKDPKDNLYKEIANIYNTKEKLDQLLTDIIKIVSQKLQSVCRILSNDQNASPNDNAAVANRLKEIIKYLLASQRNLERQSGQMLSLNTHNIEQYREKKYRKELPEQLLKYINRIHRQPCQMYNKFHTIQKRISALNAIKQHVLIPVPYVFIIRSINELIQQINNKKTAQGEQTEINKLALALLDDIMNSCQEPTTWREIESKIIDAQSQIKVLDQTKIKNINDIDTKATASRLSELIYNTKKHSIQQLYDETEDPQIKTILEPLNLENAKFCDITDEQLTWRINQSLKQLQTFLHTNINVSSSISTLTDIVKDAPFFQQKLNIQLAQLRSKKVEKTAEANTQNKNLDVEENDKENTQNKGLGVEENNKKKTQNKDLGVEENDKENTQNKGLGVEENNKKKTQNKDLDPKTFYLQSIKIVAKNIKHKCSNNTIYNDIKQAIERKYKWYVAKAFPSYINDYNSEIKKCQESLKKISQYTSDDKERQVFKMYYYRQMFLQQQKLAQSLDLTTFMSSCAKYLQNKQLAYSECFTDVCSAIHNAIIPPQYKKFIENSQKQWHNCPKPEQIVDLALSALNNIFNQISSVRNKLLQSNIDNTIKSININNTIKNIQTYYNELSNLSTQTEELKSLLTNISKEQNCNQNLKSHLHSSVLPSIDSATQLLRPLRDTTKKYLEKYTHMQKVIEYRNKISEYLEKKEQKDKDINWLLTNINPDNQNLNQQLISQNIIKPEDIIPIEEQRQLLTALNDQIKEKIKSSANSTMEECINNALKNNAVDKLNLKESLIIECPTLSQTALNNNKLSWNELKFVRCDRNGYHVSEYEKNCIQKGKTAIKLQQTTKLLNQLRTKDTFNYVADLTKETNKKKKELTDAGFWMYNTGDIAKLLETDVLPLNLVEQWIAQKNGFSRKILSNCWPFNHSATLEARIKQNDLMLLINKETNKCMAINPTTAFEEDGKIKQSIMDNVEKVFPDGNIPEIFVPENGEYHNCMDNVGTKGIICPNIPHKWFSTTSKSMENRAKKYNKVLSGIIKNKYVNCIHSSGDSNETAAWIAKLLARNNCTIDALHLRDIEKPERLADILSIQEKSDNSNIQNIVLSYSRRYDNILANGQTIGDKKINELLSNTSHKYNWKLNLHKKDRPHDEHWSLLQSQSSIKVIRDTNILSFKSEVKTLLQRLAKQRSGDTLNICAELFSNTTKIEERDGAIYITDESSQNPYFPIVIKDNQYSWVISLNDHSLTIYYNPDGTLGIYFDRIENKCNITDTCMTYTAQNMQNRQDFEVYFPIALSIFQQVIAPTLAKFHSHNKELLNSIRIPPLQTLPKDGEGIKYKKHKWTSLNNNHHQRYNINYFPSYFKNEEKTAQNNIIASNTNNMLNAQLTTNGLQLTRKDEISKEDNVIDNNIQPKDTTACVLFTIYRRNFDINLDKYNLDKYAIRDVYGNFSEGETLNFAKRINKRNETNNNNGQKPIDNIKIIIDDTYRDVEEIFATVRDILQKIDSKKLKYITFSQQTHRINERSVATQKKIRENIEKLARDYNIPIYYAQPLVSEVFKAKNSLLTKYTGSANQQKKYFRTDAQYNLQAITREQKRQTQFELKNIKNDAEYNLGANVNVNQL